MDAFLNDFWIFDGTYWTWISGSDRKGGSGKYGSKGVPDPSNEPSKRVGAVSWIDPDNNLYLFGGGHWVNGYYTTSYNDLWKYDGKYWTWISGTNAVNNVGSYGQKGVPSSSNVPPARLFAVGWTDSHNNLYLFGGSVSGTGGK